MILRRFCWKEKLVEEKDKIQWNKERDVNFKLKLFHKVAIRRKWKNVIKEQEIEESWLVKESGAIAKKIIRLYKGLIRNKSFPDLSLKT